MTFWDKLRSVLKSEASDIGDELGKARDNFDAALTRKEEEMAATPKERMDMILDDIGDSDAEFDRIRDKAEGRTSIASATAEVRESATGDAASKADSAPKVADTLEDALEEASSSHPPAEVTAPGDTVDSGGTVGTGDTVDAGGTVGPDDTVETAESAVDAVDVAAAERAAAEAEALEAAEERQRQVAARRAAADAKFEQQKAKADDLLDELRGELGIDD